MNVPFEKELENVARRMLYGMAKEGLYSAKGATVDTAKLQLGEDIKAVQVVLKDILLPLLEAGQAMRDDERSRGENTLRANKPLRRTTAATLWDAARERLAQLEKR